MSKLQVAFIILGLLMIMGGILLLLFPQVMKFVFAPLGILAGVWLIVVMAKAKKQTP